MPNIVPFDPQLLKQLHHPQPQAAKTENGQVTIISGSDLFHGPPSLALKISTRIVDMVFFTSPEPTIKEFALYLKSQIANFIWIPFEEVTAYMQKSDTMLIGPGLKRFRSENNHPGSNNNILDIEGTQTKNISEALVQALPHKQWIIDAGTLQTIDPQLLPPNAIITPNHKELQRLFSLSNQSPLLNPDTPIETKAQLLHELSHRHNITIIAKGQPTIVTAPNKITTVPGGNPGMSKGATGDCLAALTTSLAAKSDPYLAACSADYLIKKTADDLYQRVGPYYSADDIVRHLPTILYQNIY